MLYSISLLLTYYMHSSLYLLTPYPMPHLHPSFFPLVTTNLFSIAVSCSLYFKKSPHISTYLLRVSLHAAADWPYYTKSAYTLLVLLASYSQNQSQMSPRPFIWLFPPLQSFMRFCFAYQTLTILIFFHSL